MLINMGINAVAAGTGDAIVLTYSPAFALGNNRVLFFRASAANTGAVTINANGTGALPLTQKGGTALASGMIPAAGYFCAIEYQDDNDRYELVNPFPIYGTSANTWCQGNDSRLSDSRNTRVIFKSMVDSPHTGNTNETRIFSVPIPAGTYQTGDFIIREIEWGSTANGNSKTLRTYYNDTDDLVSPTLAATHLVTTTATRVGHTRQLEMVNAASEQYCIMPTSTIALYTQGQANGLSNLGLDFTNNAYYLIVSVQLQAGTDTSTLFSIRETIIR